MDGYPPQGPGHLPLHATLPLQPFTLPLPLQSTQYGGSASATTTTTGQGHGQGQGQGVTQKKEPVRRGRRKINIEYIQDKTRRQITFSKRKAGIMKKAYELATLTGTQVLLLVASETGHVYTFATPKFQPLITEQEGKNIIQNCLNTGFSAKESENTEHTESSSVNSSFHPYAHKRELEEDADADDDDDDDIPDIPQKSNQKLPEFNLQPNYMPIMPGLPTTQNNTVGGGYDIPQHMYGRQMVPTGLFHGPSDPLSPSLASHPYGAQNHLAPFSPYVGGGYQSQGQSQGQGQGQSQAQSYLSRHGGSSHMMEPPLEMLMTDMRGSDYLRGQQDLREDHHHMRGRHHDDQGGTDSR